MPCIVCACLSTGRLSPVSADSSALQLALSKMRQSAGTLSPASKRIMSPITKLRLSVYFTTLSRKTLHCAFVSVCNASRAFSALLSCITPRVAFNKTTTEMIMTSAKDSRSLFGSALFTNVKTRLTIAAASKIIIIGSASCFKKRNITGVFLRSASLFSPCCLRRFAASCSLKPLGEEFSCSSVSPSVKR